MNKLFFKLLLWSIISLVASFQVSASHIIGSDISYKCTSTPGIFEITLVLYRNCDAASLCSNTCGGTCVQGIRVQGADPGCEGTTFFSPNLDLVSVRDVNINLRCPTSKNTCNNMNCVSPGTYTPGVERYEFKGFVNIGPTSGIPANCCNVRFSWDLCCRNGQIATGSANQQFYMEAVVNRCLSVSPCNSSPELSNDPFAVMCGGENFVFNNGAIDPDYDSLTFAFTPCLQGANQPVSYILPWAYDKPMPWSGAPDAEFPGGIHCDPETGDITFTPGGAPVANWYGVMAIAVKQWKTINGVPTVIGTTRRDMQMVLLANCQPNNIPRFVTNPPEGSNPNAPKYKWETHAGEQLCFTVTAKDTDLAPPTLSDTTFLSWNAALANLGATFKPTYTNRSVNGPREDVYQFCWTPDSDKISTYPYYFTITAKDSRCPNPGSITRAFSVKVKAPADFSITKQNTGCGNWKVGYVKASASDSIFSTTIYLGKVADDFTFANGKDSFVNIQTTPAFKKLVPGKYLIMITGDAGYKTITKYDTLLVDTPLSVSVADTTICSSAAVQLQAIAQGGSKPLMYRWYNSIKDTLSPPLNTPFNLSTFTPPVLSASHWYTVQVRDVLDCKAYDSTFIKVGVGVKTIIANRVSCFGKADGSIRVLMNDTIYPYQYKMETNAYQASNLFTGLAAGTYTVSVTDTAGCVNTYSVTVPQPVQLHDTLTTVTPITCYGINNAKFQTTAKGGTTPYKYSIDSVTFGASGIFSNLAPGMYTIYITDSSNCLASVTREVTSVDSLRIVPVVTSPSCYAGSNGNILFSVTGGTKPYLFKYGSAAYVTDSVYRNRPAGKYGYSILDAKQCLKSDSVVVSQPAQLLASGTVVDVNCFGGNDGSVVLTASGGTGPYKYRQGTGAYVSTSLFSGLSKGTYSYAIMDSLLCTATISKTIEQPAVVKGSVAITHPISCFGRADASVEVTATGGRGPLLYAIHGDVYTSSNVFNQLNSGTYKFAVKDSTGCKDSSLSIVLADPPQIVVSAISGSTTVALGDTQTYRVNTQAGVSYMWAVQNGTIVGNNNAPLVNVKWPSLGTGEVQVVLYTDSACSDSSTLAVNIGSTAVREVIGNSSGIKMYPNPVSHTLHITIEKLSEGNRVQLFDINGRLVYDEAAAAQQSINMEGLTSGMYLLRVGDWQQKVVKE